MSWAKVDDGWWSHPKVGPLSLPARGLWISALSWSCHQRTAIVPTYLLGMIGASGSEADELLDAGLWDQHDDGYEIHDWSEYQEQSLSEKRAEAGSKGGKRSAATRAKGKQTASKPDLVEEPNAQAGPSLPGPARPVPSHPEPGSISGDLPVPPEPVAAEPLPMSDDDVEQAARRALRIYATAKAEREATSNPVGLVDAIWKAAHVDDRMGRLRGFVRDGMTPEDAAEELERFALLDGPRRTTGPSEAEVEAARVKARRAEEVTRAALDAGRTAPAATADVRTRADEARRALATGAAS